MSKIQELKAEARTGRGKGPAYQARLKGLIPAVVYGGDAEAETVSVDARTLERHVEAGHFLTTLFQLDVAGAKTRVIPRDVQLDPVSDRPVHVDFLRLAQGATVKLNIPVHFNGQEASPGLKKGGVLNIARHSIVLLCPAESIPNTVEVDVAKLDIMDTVHFEDLTLPEGVKPVVRGRDTTVCSIVASSTVREEQKKAAAGGDAPAEATPAAAAAAPAAGAKAPAAGAKAAPAAAAKPAAKK
jgi:large subunit ribosomal protein L25